MSVYKVLKHVSSVARQERRPNCLTLGKMLPNSFYFYFTKLDSIHSCNTRQKRTKYEFFRNRARTEMGNKKLQHICLKVWKNIPKKDRGVSFYGFKKSFNMNANQK